MRRRRTRILFPHGHTTDFARLAMCSVIRGNSLKSESGGVAGQMILLTRPKLRLGYAFGVRIVCVKRVDKWIKHPYNTQHVASFSEPRLMCERLAG